MRSNPYVPGLRHSLSIPVFIPFLPICTSLNCSFGLSSENQPSGTQPL
jgi:hypothetical protein